MEEDDDDDDEIIIHHEDAFPYKNSKRISLLRRFAGRELTLHFLGKLSLFRVSMLQTAVAFMCHYNTAGGHTSTRSHTCTRTQTHSPARAHTHTHTHTTHTHTHKTQTTHNHTQVGTALFPLKHCFRNILMKIRL